MPENLDIAANLAEIHARIARAAGAGKRAADSVQLVAVSKTKSAELILEAIAAGHLVFGENRVQEAQAKYPEIKARHPAVKLHLIGPLQTNKAKSAVELFDVIETLDRPKLARALAKEAARAGHCPECFVQVNTGEEAQKAGVAPAEADALIALARDELGLPVTGLMCIPPLDEPASPHFALLAKIAARNCIDKLSMGMSADFELAVQMGATHVRVGTAIFGSRPPVAPPGEAGI